jgi:anthranilate phosphoribosyltransferase
VVLNSAAALIVAGIAKDFAEGIKLANESLDTKKALAKLEALRQCS